MSYSVDCRYIRNEKANCLKASYVSMVKLERNILEAEEYECGTIIPIRQEAKSSLDCGGVVTNDGKFVRSSIVPGWVTGWYDDYECIESDRTAVYCGRMIGHWGHFLLECVTRLWFFLEKDDPNYVYVFIVKEGSEPPIEGNFLQFFELLGIWNRLMFLNEATRYRRVIVPERSFQYKRFCSPQYVAVFDRVIDNALILKIDGSFSDKLYLSRGCFERALQSEVGLKMLDDYFAENGYEIIYPENISLIELIHRLNAAHTCASESGTTAHNFLFCRNKHRVIVVERQSVVNEAQASIDIVRKLRTIYLDSHLTLDCDIQPCFLYYTTYMKHMTENLGYKPPDQVYTSVETLKKNLYFYAVAYQKMHAKQSANIVFKDHEVRCLEEAMHESQELLNALGFKLSVPINSSNL